MNYIDEQEVYLLENTYLCPTHTKKKVSLSTLQDKNTLLTKDRINSQ